MGMGYGSLYTRFGPWMREDVCPFFKRSVYTTVNKPDGVILNCNLLLGLFKRLRKLQTLNTSPSHSSQGGWCLEHRVPTHWTVKRQTAPCRPLLLYLIRKKRFIKFQDDIQNFVKWLSWCKNLFWRAFLKVNERQIQNFQDSSSLSRPKLIFVFQ